MVAAQLQKQEVQQSEIQLKIKHADEIFHYICQTSNDGHPHWSNADAQHFGFDTHNALRHFVRKYSLAYKDYRAQKRDEARSRTTGVVKAPMPLFSDTLLPSESVIHSIINQHRQARFTEITFVPTDSKGLTVWPPAYTSIGPYTNGQPPAMNPVQLFTEKNLLDQVDAISTQTVPKPDLSVLRLTGNLIVIGDLFIPMTRWEFVARMMTIAGRHLEKPRTIVLGGELISDQTIDDMERKFKISDQLLSYWATVFDNIYISPGSKLHRLVRRLRDDDSMEAIAKSLTNAHEKVKMLPFERIEVKSGDQEWVVIGRDRHHNSPNHLAQKYQANVAMFNSNTLSRTRDQHNRYALITAGSMRSDDQNNSFILLRNGVGHLLSTHPGETDWKLWI